MSLGALKNKYPDVIYTVKAYIFLTFWQNRTHQLKVIISQSWKTRSRPCSSALMILEYLPTSLLLCWQLSRLSIFRILQFGWNFKGLLPTTYLIRKKLFSWNYLFILKISSKDELFYPKIPIWQNLPNRIFDVPSVDWLWFFGAI